MLEVDLHGARPGRIAGEHSRASQRRNRIGECGLETTEHHPARVARYRVQGQTDAHTPPVAIHLQHLDAHEQERRIELQHARIGEDATLGHESQETLEQPGLHVAASSNTMQCSMAVRSAFGE